MLPIQSDRVAQRLEHNPQHLRIKKLLICTCYGIWESQVEQIHRISMRDLLETVLMRSPTLDSLHYELNRVVKTLSKPVEYAHVAHSIVTEMVCLYQQPTPPAPAPETTPEANPEATQVLAPSPKPGFPDPSLQGEQTGWLMAPNPEIVRNPYTEALQQLKTNPYGDRLKKLAVCACENIWENDPVRLKAMGWEKILPQLLDLLPQRQNLNYVLVSIVNSLSKPEVYRPIARTLVQILLPLYDEDDPPLTFRDSPAEEQPTQILAPPPPPSPLQAADTGLISPVAPPPHLDTLQEATTVGQPDPRLNYPVPPPPPAPAFPPSVSSDATVFSTVPIHQSFSPAPAAAPDTGDATVFSTVPLDATVFSTVPLVESDSFGSRDQWEPEQWEQEDWGQEDWEQEQWQSQDDSSGLTPPNGTAIASTPTPSPSPTYNAFDLRIELMKYTNPLMVKILIYSLLYCPFDFRTSDWQELKEFDLDSLVTSLYNQYHHYPELKTCLESMANQLPEPDLALQSAATLLRVLKPSYLQR